MKLKIFSVVFFLILVVLPACAANQNPPTPTVVRLERTENRPDSAQVSNVLPTATPIPPPSPTPSPTQIPLLTLTTATPTVTPAASPLAEVIAAGLNVRQGPGVDYPVTGAASAGDRFKVVGLDPSGNWLQVVTENNDPAWISAQPTFIRLLGVDRAELPFVQPPEPVSSEVGAGVRQTAPSRSEGLDGRLIFTTSSGGELYTVQADGTDLRRLAGGVIDPVLSPNGRSVAFVRWDGAKQGALYTIDLASGRERVVLGGIRQPKSPTWSPDGEAIIISFQHGGRPAPEEICKEYDYDDGIRLPGDIAEITKFRMSSDGIVLCYILRKDLRWGMRRIDLSSGEFEDLPVNDYSYNPAWDPQNPWRVVYDGEKGLMAFDVNRNSQWELTTDRRDTGPVFSPDGRYLALTYKQHDHWELYTLDLETGERNRLTKPPILADPQYNSAAPAWSPDGTHLAFLTDRTGRWEIWVMQADGSNQRPLLPPEIQAKLNFEYYGVNERMLNWAQ
jgi:dipeptidyl aminopeptidase/acylaminoacyl peptidase